MANPVMLSDKLYKELMDLVERGDDKALREYITAHLDEFPEKARDTIVMAFVEEALDKSNADAKRVADFQEAGLQMLKGLDNAQAQAEKRKKLLGIKEGL